MVLSDTCELLGPKKGKHARDGGVAAAVAKQLASNKSMYVPNHWPTLVSKSFVTSQPSQSLNYSFVRPSCTTPYVSFATNARIE